MKISTKDITKYLNSSNKNFKTFDITYSKDDEKAIDNLQVDIKKDYNHYGTIDTMIGLPIFLKEIGPNSNTTVSKVEKLINQLIKNCLLAWKKDYAWISVRATIPTNEYDIPRWHKDGNFRGFDNSPDQSKFIIVLKGPGTLAIKQTKEVDEIFSNINQKELETRRSLYNKYKRDLTYKESNDIYDKVNKKFRPMYVKALSKFKILQPNKLQALVFHTQTTLHSEPKTDVPRLFVSIMPGSKAFIEGFGSVIIKK